MVTKKPIECPRKCSGHVEEADCGWWECTDCDNRIRHSVVDGFDSFKRVAKRGGPASEIAQAALGILREGFDQRYVYAIRDARNRVKIGKSKDPQRRLRELEVGNPEALELFCSAEVRDASSLERDLHRKFANENLRGEWFQLPEEEQAELKNVMQIAAEFTLQ